MVYRGRYGYRRRRFIRRRPKRFIRRRRFYKKTVPLHIMRSKAVRAQQIKEIRRKRKLGMLPNPTLLDAMEFAHKRKNPSQ